MALNNSHFKFKTAVKIITILCFLIFIIIFLNNFLKPKSIKIETKYGDQFTVLCDDTGDLYSICDTKSNFSTDIYYFSDKDQFQSVCDNQYIRCYHILDGREDGFKDRYIFKIKKDDVFFAVRFGDIKSSSEYMFKEDAEMVKRVFFCDINLMKICIYDLDYYYPNEMIDIAQKLISGNYDGLEQYGLTQEMINDKESLNEKIKIMEDYLKNNKE